ncbi:hypothetical protein Pth03_05260 [Planotetraspora thailandica]|uniref:SnoaL-like domain-containing protein n=1 Tax=Planotetraspora thailandica TaxID=487172 RepID=A0A8J3UYE9_9ACTN|nr:nuclear transport factor 2 family protein [Planotetraspora thailandica]GII52137.1 hypothetical protein Pth03_05260 [Planotetraspora thailandica]
MNTTTRTEMPTPVARYFTGMNALDGDAMAAAFAEDGMVNDIRREFLGRDAIRRWAEEESVAAKVVVTRFVQARAHHGDWIADVEVDGEYDKTGLPDPLVLTFYFSLDGDEVSRLIIIGNRPDEPES